MLLDTSAWTEFFIKSSEGEKVKESIKNQNCYTSMTSIAEISNWAAKQNKNTEELIGFVKSLTQMIELSDRISARSGELNFQRKKIERNWGMLDSFILSTAQIYNLKILTKDRHFKDLPNVELL